MSGGVRPASRRDPADRVGYCLDLADIAKMGDGENQRCVIAAQPQAVECASDVGFPVR